MRGLFYGEFMQVGGAGMLECLPACVSRMGCNRVSRKCMAKSVSEQNKNRADAFAAIYESGYWGGGRPSGAGSTLEATTTTRNIVTKIIADYEIKSIVDVACGDFTWMPLVLQAAASKLRYTGCDIVAGLVTQHT